MRRGSLSLINALSVALALFLALGMGFAVLTAGPPAIHMEARL